MFTELRSNFEFGVTQRVALGSSIAYHVSLPLIAKTDQEKCNGGDPLLNKAVLLSSAFEQLLIVNSGFWPFSAIVERNFALISNLTFHFS